MSDHGFFAVVSTILESTDLDARRLTLEVTESLFEGNVEGRTKLLCKLRGIGVQIAIDDFGTGYSSLRSLRDMPVDILKIDKSFVDHIVSSAEAASLVEMILQLAKNLGMRTVAEGVEELSQLETLREMGCHLIQGYYFSKPLPAGELQTFLQQELTVLEKS
jgi:EAL domain-containing protein (putative c-di-GMP-specific phosphodiesterase class I)